MVPAGADQPAPSDVVGGGGGGGGETGPTIWGPCPLPSGCGPGRGAPSRARGDAGSSGTFGRVRRGLDDGVDIEGSGGM